MNGIRVYVADTKELNDDLFFGKLYKTVSRQRREKIDRMVFRKDKMLSLAAGLLLKKGLEDQGIDAADLQVRYGKNNKPYIEGIHFNLSHSEEKVMCAISDREVGCDVEKVTDIDMEIAKRFFYTTEYALIAGKRNHRERCETFFRLWTLKESFMKATGLGMELALDAFRIDVEGDRISVWQRVDEKTYYFREYEMKDGYQYAVCGLTPEFGEMEAVSFLEI